jgi:ribosome recycling factor
LKPIRSFTTSVCLHKKGGKAARDERQASRKEAPVEDPGDFTTLESDIAAAIEQLRDDLSNLRAGGRFNTEVLEDLRVQPDKNSKQWVRLSDLAQVIPKGRTVQILVGEKDVCSFSIPLSSADF